MDSIVASTLVCSVFACAIGIRRSRSCRLGRGGRAARAAGGDACTGGCTDDQGGRERDLLLAAGSYTAIEARSSSRADVTITLITVQQLTTGH